MKKLISLLTVLTLLLGTLAALPVSATDTDTLDDHLITHWDFAGDDVLADKAPNGTPDTLIEGNPFRIAYADGLATLKIGGPGCFYAENSDDLLRTPALTSADDSDKYDRTIFIRFKITEFQDTDEFAYVMNQNGAFSMVYRLNGTTKELRTFADLTLDRNSAKVSSYDVSEFVTVAVVYDKNYSTDAGESMATYLYSALESGSNEAIVSSSTDAKDLRASTCTASADGSTTCSCGKSGTDYNGACVDRFYIGGSSHHKNIGNGRNMVIDDIRIYDKALTGDELLQVKASITNPEPTPDPVPPTSTENDTAQFTNAGHSLTLKGNTEINYYFTSVEGATISDSAEVTLTDPEGKTVDTVALSEVTKTDGTYKYSYGVAAKQMNDTFTLTVSDGGSTVYTNTYSVREYAKYIIDNASNYEAKLVDLVKALLNYGAYSQLSFSYNTGSLATAGLDISAPAAITVTEGLGATTSGSVTGITYSAATLVLNDVTHVVFKFIVNGVNSADIAVAGADDYKVIAGTTLQVQSAGLVADKLNDEVSVSVTVGNETLTVSYSPLAYIMNMAGVDDVNTQNLVKALYAYYLAADAYTA